jgi:outer membrane protein OmpA-like peptidoglycan-associated protein
MKFRSNSVAAVVAVMLAAAPAISAPGNRVGGYDFGYATNGDTRIAPVQIFDNGKDTYFQFRAGDPIPAIFQVKGKEVNLMVPTFEGPYVKIPNTSGRYTLQLGRSQAQVVYVTGSREEGVRIDAFGANGQRISPANASRDSNSRLVASLDNSMQYLSATNLEANSYATPVRGDRVEWRDSETVVENEQVWFPKGQGFLGKNALRDVAALGGRFRNASAVTIIGRDDDSYKQGLELARANSIRATLIKAGVPANVITVKAGPTGKADKGLWPSDLRIETVVPTKVARPGNPSGDASRENIHQLLRSGVISPDQAIALLRRAGQQELAAKAEEVRASVQQQADVKNAAASEQSSKQVDSEPVKFDFRVSDRNISTTLRRWGQATKYEVVWSAPASDDAAVNGTTVLAATSMKQAVEMVVASMRRKGYQINATIYSNRVIVFSGNAK